MNDAFSDPEDSDKVDHLVPEGNSEIPPEAENFSSEAQRDKFLGGGGGKTPAEEQKTGQPERQPKTPTEASDNFLVRIRNRIANNWRNILPLAVGGGIWLNGNLIDDFSRGDYRLAAFKGAIAAASALPMLLHWSGGEAEAEETGIPTTKTAEGAEPVVKEVAKPTDGGV